MLAPAPELEPRPPPLISLLPSDKSFSISSEGGVVRPRVVAVLIGSGGMEPAGKGGGGSIV